MRDRRCNELLWAVAFECFQRWTTYVNKVEDYTFFMDGKRFIGGDEPSIADIRLAATLEFLRAIDYEFPAWTEKYMADMETTLGDAYTEPARDVRGYIASVKSQSD